MSLRLHLTMQSCTAHLFDFLNHLIIAKQAPKTLNLQHRRGVGNRSAQPGGELLKCFNISSCCNIVDTSLWESISYCSCFFSPPHRHYGSLIVSALVSHYLFSADSETAGPAVFTSTNPVRVQEGFRRNWWGEKQLPPLPKQFVFMSLTACSLNFSDRFPSANVFARDQTTRGVISGALKQPGTQRQDEKQRNGGTGRLRGKVILNAQKKDGRESDKRLQKTAVNAPVV